MASDSILTSIPFWVAIGVIFAIAVAWAVCFGTRVNPFRRCGECFSTIWTLLTCCCPGRETEAERAPKETASESKAPEKLKDDPDLERALAELQAMRDTLPLLPLQERKKDECKWDKRDYLLERAAKTPTVV